MAHREEARRVITERVQYFASTYNFTYKRIAIKNTKRTWGSCSALGNLNFNYRLLFLPDELRDYIVVHELCHLRQLNHGPAFWAEVEAILLNYEALIKDLKVLERAKLVT